MCCRFANLFVAYETIFTYPRYLYLELDPLDLDALSFKKHIYLLIRFPIWIKIG